MSLTYLLSLKKFILKHSQVAVVIFVNGSTPNSTWDNLQRCSKKIREQLFESCIGSQRIFILSHLFESTPTIGRIRGVMTDGVISSQIGATGYSPTILFNDADTLDVAPDYFEQMSRLGAENVRFASGPVWYGFPGPAHMDRQGYKFPELFLFNVTQAAILRLARQGKINFEKRIWPEGANFLVNAAFYCAVGGFDYERSSGEDDALGRALHRFNPNALSASEISPDTIFRMDPVFHDSFLDDAWIVTDPRRVLAAISNGKLGVEAWTEIPFSQNFGANISLLEAQRQYEGDPKLLQCSALGDLRVEGRGAEFERIAERIISIVLSTGRYDFRIRNECQMKLYLWEVGLAISDEMEINTENILGGANLESSPLLRLLSTFPDGRV